MLSYSQGFFALIFFIGLELTKYLTTTYTRISVSEERKYVLQSCSNTLVLSSLFYYFYYDNQR